MLHGPPTVVHLSHQPTVDKDCVWLSVGSACFLGAIIGLSLDAPECAILFVPGLACFWISRNLNVLNRCFGSAGSS